jgi:hypothetical protein
MSEQEPNWRPSRAEQRLLWWLDLTLKFAIGGGGLIWELAIDRGRNPLVLLVCGMLAMSTNAFQFLKQLILTARAEQQELDQMLEEEQQRKGRK